MTPLADNGEASIILTNQILSLLRDSGVSKSEAFSALNAVRALLPSLPLAHVPPPEESLEQCFPDPER